LYANESITKEEINMNFPMGNAAQAVQTPVAGAAVFTQVQGGMNAGVQSVAPTAAASIVNTFSKDEISRREQNGKGQ
jgi:hypothetical protein